MTENGANRIISAALWLAHRLIFDPLRLREDHELVRARTIARAQDQRPAQRNSPPLTPTPGAP